MVGLLLSDGHLEKSSPTSASRLSVNFSLKHASYLMHLYNLLEPYTNSGPDIISVSKTVGGENMVLKFKTVSLPLFAVYHRMFYQYNSAGGGRPVEGAHFSAPPFPLEFNKD